jgi:hypothetical protein
MQFAGSRNPPVPVALTVHTIVTSLIKNANFFCLVCSWAAVPEVSRHAARRITVRNLLTRACACRHNLLYKHTIPYTVDEYIFFSS